MVSEHGSVLLWVPAVLKLTAGRSGVLLVKKRSRCPNAHVLGTGLNVAVCPPPQDLPLQGCGE